MDRVWLILNRASRSVGDNWETMLTDALAARGAEVVGVTDFPDDALPEPKALDDGRIDTLVVAAGDGTVNATAAAFDAWGGQLLVLPGGTMNLLAKQLHGPATPDAIVAAVASPAQTRRLATIDAPGIRAIVGAIIGPAASWVHAREAVRAGRWSRLRRAVALAYRRTLARSVHVCTGGMRSRGYRAVFVHADGDALSLVKVRASGWADGVRLGWSYMTGSWEGARGIDTEKVTSFELAETGPTFALFDGEPTRLPPRACLRLGRTRLKFVTTL